MFKSKRLLVNIAIFGTFLFIPFVPWYATFLAGIVAAWHFSYYEFIVLGFLMDVFFASSHFSFESKNMIIDATLPFVSSAPSFFGTFFFTFITASIILVLQMIKKRVRFYS